MRWEVYGERRREGVSHGGVVRGLRSRSGPPAPDGSLAFNLTSSSRPRAPLSHYDSSGPIHNEDRRSIDCLLYFTMSLQ